MRLLAVAADLFAIIVLAGLVYFPRHRRRDMLLAYAGANVGVLAVTVGLEETSVAAGLGLGLFGVLSIIRLRSRELGQTEVAYYFLALAMGLVGGLDLDRPWLNALLLSAMVGAAFVADHPRLFGNYRQLLIDLDVAYTSETEARQRLSELLDADVQRVVLLDVDLVRDRTRVDVRYRLPGPRT